MMRHPSTLLLLLVMLSGTLNVSDAGGGSVSNKPELKTDKSKIQMLQSFAPAKERDPVQPDNVSDIPPVDEVCSVGDYLSGVCKVHPLVVAYMQKDSELEGYDIHAAVSLDEGGSWKRTNLSKNARRGFTYHGRPCFTQHDEGDGDDHDHGHRLLGDEHGEETFDFSGDNFKPMIVAKGNKILVAWTSTMCKGGVPGDNDGEANDPQNHLRESDAGSGGGTDYHMVKGHQTCYDRTTNGLGKRASKCVWAARGMVRNDGEIWWTKPERLTSGRRDAFQLVASAASQGKAWALAWQEDPKGLRIGEAEGPGDGMSGATTNHKTDIWYSYVGKSAFDGDWYLEGDSNMHTVPDANRFSSPVRVTDNAACKVEHEYNEYNETIPKIVDGDLVYKGGPYCRDNCVSLTETDKENARYPLSCTTAAGVPLDGDTGASRPNMFLIPDDDLGVRVVLAYEESKGLGKGPGSNHDETGEEDENFADREDWGKNIYYHTFKFDDPDEIAHGSLVNLPEVLENGEPSMTEDGTEFLTNNARRARLIVQPKTKWGTEQVGLVMLYREGVHGHGRPAHIVMRRFVGGYEPDNIECQNTRKDPSGNKVCVSGTTDLNADNIAEDGEEDDARAHRGFIRGDFLVLGYTYTAKWGRGMPKRYDFYIRRSVDGGKKFTNFKGNKEGPVNLSNIKEEGNRGWSVMEPRLYATPGSIKDSPSKNDKQNSMVYFAAYTTTHHPQGDIEEKDRPMDLLWTMTDNFGESYMKELNEENGEWQFPWFAKVKGDNDDAGFAGAQIRCNPAGNKLLASFQADVNSAEGGFIAGGGPCRGNGQGSDVCFENASRNPFKRYDLDGNGKVDDEDESMLQLAMETGSTNTTYDLNGDGEITGHDLHLMNAAMQESSKYFGTRRHAYLRRRE